MWPPNAIALGEQKGQVMKIAFLILNHRDPAQLLRLLATLRQQLPDSTLVVHHDKYRTDLDPHALEHLGGTYLLTSEQPTIWGDFTLANAIWQSIAWMLGNLEFDWLMLLSAQDYPIRPLHDLGHYLAGTGADAVLLAEPIANIANRPDRRDRHRRYLYQYRPARTRSTGANEVLRNAIRRRAGLLADVLNYLQPYVQIYRFPDGMPWRIGFPARTTPFTDARPCWFGSMWISLSRDAARFVVDAVRDRPDYVHYYRHAIYPDESVTLTLLCNEPRIRVEQRELHYIRWTNPKSGHPDLLTADDAAELKVASASAYFARKFDIGTDPEVFDKLDELLLSPAADPPIADPIDSGEGTS
jgi:hypothetical protein